MKNSVGLCIALFCVFIIEAQSPSLKILNFQGDNGFQHESKNQAKQFITQLGVANDWVVVSTDDAGIFNARDLFKFHVVIFNNNCGNTGRILNKQRQLTFQNYIRRGGGFMGIHCAGAIFNEGGSYQLWYEKLVGTKLTNHSKVQKATILVENSGHYIAQHIVENWEVNDEWHAFSYNPRANVNVLLSVDESTYKGTPKMDGDHPVAWYHFYDGGRSFFTTLGHTESTYKDNRYIAMIKNAIVWAAGKKNRISNLPVQKDLLLDLDGNHGIEIDKMDKVISWKNRIVNNIGKFEHQDSGRTIKGSGMPRLVLNVPELNGNNVVVFHRQELVNHQEDAFDHLITGSGYTWFSVICVYQQVSNLPGVNSFFGNLRNNNKDGGKYEGLWAGLTDDNRVWTGSRNARTFGRWDENNPQLLAPEPLEEGKYYVVVGRMAAGTGEVTLELFVNENVPVAIDKFPVNTEANASKLVMGQERDAVEHPGKESFDGAIARFMIYDRSLTDEELASTMDYLKKKYGL